MKKKFFTLLAAAAFLVGTAVPALAAVPNTSPVGSLVGPNAKGLVDGQNRGLYHIANMVVPGGGVQPTTVDGVLSVNSSTGAVTIKKTNLGAALSETLWCVAIDAEEQGKNPSFTFLNKAYGDNLRAENTAMTPLYLDGPLVDWSFSKVYGADVELNVPRPLYSYINSSQAAVLVKGSGSTGVKTVIANVADIENTWATYATVITPVGTTTSETLLYFTLVEAAPLVLTADQFNTKLGSELGATGQKLTFTPDRNTGDNPFSENVLTAEPGSGNNASRYLRLKNTAGKYLRVDTSLVNATGSYFLDFKFEDLKTTPAWLRNQYEFRFVYYPSHDSLTINVKGALQPSKTLQEVDGYKFFSQLIGIGGGHGERDGQLVSADDFTVTANLVDFTYVILQDLNDQKIVTIGELPSQTRISLGLGGCAAASNKTSLEGLYTIQNTEGKYLQVPIYTDSVAAPQWVTLEKNVDPFQMPSFQWVVEKLRTNDPDNTSQIKIANREYGISLGTVQLYNDQPTVIFGGKEVGANAAGFTEVPAAQRLDKYLGYKYVSVDESVISTYTFNYLHEFANDRYLSVNNAQKDTMLYVQTDADAFELSAYHHSLNNNNWSYTPRNYGYHPASWTTKGYAAQLVRTAYVLKVKEGGKIWNTDKVVVVDKENRYAVTKTDVGYIQPGDSAVFYLKTNNTKDGRNFYALVDISSFNDIADFTFPTSINPSATEIAVKAGVDDNNVWVKAQNFKEIRTSAFAIEKNEDPLYRRFNRTVDGIENGATSFYDDVDAPVKLRFHRVNNANEFLYEDAHSVYSEGLGINFLGYKHKADFGLADEAFETRTTFYVDTAYVNRPATSVDFDTPKPQYLIGVGVKIYSDGTIDQGECEPEIVTEGYTRGRYLINATDSVYGVGNWSATRTNTVKNSNYIWDTKWERLAFVDAIHKGDTLYILNGQNYNDPIQNFQALRDDAKVTKVWLGENIHKDVVFSFRLINDEKETAYASQTQSFLIESETTDRTSTPMIAPYVGGWVKLQNGVPVISRGAYSDAITDAERFNTISAANVDPAATPNEDINVTAVKVVAGNGNVTILNAAGKTVTISNILGQTVANTTISSDNVTIAAPKGIVVVAVQGEDAVKAIVK